MQSRQVPVSPALVLALLGAWAVASALWFVSPWFPMQTLAGLEQATGGWLSVTLLASATIGLVELAILLGPGRQSLAGLGWQPTHLGPALQVALLLWLLMQAGSLLGGAGEPGPWLPWHPSWERGLGIALGPLLAQLLGTALFEETVFRGFLWPQLSARLGGGRRGAWLGALLSQAAFAALHVPILLHNGVAPGELAGPLLGLFLSGLVLLTVYAATGNLFIAVGIHALGNAPTLLFQPQGLPPSVWLLGGTLVLIALAWWWRRKNETRLAAGSRAMAPD